MKDLKIYGAIKKYADNSPYRFHMPAHKGKNFLSGGAKYDVTELPSIDNAAVVLSAEEDCAKILGAKKVFFLTGGSTSGILSSFYAVKGLGKKIIINRSAHKSVYNGLKLFSIEPVIVDDEIEDITPELISKVFDNEKDAFAALLTYPDYFGRTFDLKGVKAVCEKKGKILIIDGAHGNHFKFLNLPYSGSIADISVESLHKTAYTFNQGAIICVNDEKLIDKVKDGVNTFLTTSPSYPLLASIEYGIKRQALDYGKTQKVIARLDKAKEEIKVAGLSVLPSEDPLKMTVIFTGSGYDGNEIAKVLEKHKIFPELAGKNEILFMLSAATKTREINKLVKTIIKAVKTLGKREIQTENAHVLRKREMPYLKAVNGEWEFTPIDKAKGKICAENFGVVPPCRPLFTAGELIDADVSDMISGETFGFYNGNIKTVKVKK